ncbi:3'(2'),5'-bisphosphate nucleotidase CysQ [Helicobacter sp.]|uniref:3'(2'),5'-bisphosphate nucleotidase CysQ family protein n=1 Tax=Helicobacter sp. TaxID=218 RepID=UPI00258C9099|nr:3'(2'),5'-bisphosphate nucleotidase CysQ [Helicobacter sp.]MCI7047818.1 3'(2'),5'-bisphosphate nucleotidase CysQ [Helicobacter sp.]
MQNLLYKVTLITIEAGKIALRYYGKEEFSLKEDSSPITQADLESNAYITQALQKISSYAVCSEEAVLEYAKRKDLEYYWLIDPLDGTKDFLAKNGGWTINIALIHKNHPILGVVYAPCFDELYMGLEGFGSYTIESQKLKNTIESHCVDEVFLDLNKIRLNGERNIADKQLVACDSMFHSTESTQEFLKKYHLKVQKYGSSLKVCALARGEADLYPRFNGTSEWDMAACDIVLREAGGVILDCMTKKPLLYNKESFRNNHFIAFSKSQIGGQIYRDLLAQE